jgi:predicted permease
MIPILVEEFGRGGGFEQAQFGPRLRWLKEMVVGDLRDTLWLLMGTMGLLLAMACANVANLVLVRTLSRRPELALRTALGAGRAAIARLVFAECAILGLAGGAAGLAVAYVSLPLLLSIGATDLPPIMTVAIDPIALLGALGTSMLATVSCALVPVLSLLSPRLPLAQALQAGGRALSDGREGSRARHLLVVSQVALALVLLVGSGLMIRTFQMLRQVDPGFRDPESVLTFQLTIPPGTAAASDPGVTGPEPTLRVRQAMLDRLVTVAGVESAAFSAFNDGLPLDADGRRAGIVVEGSAPVDGGASTKEIQFVSPDFFETLRTPVIAGRTFDWDDVHQGRRVVLVSENLARREWESGSAALGKRLGLGSSSAPFEVVGVVRDVHHDGLSVAAPEVVVFPAVSSEAASFVVRSDRIGTTGFLDEIRQAIWSVNPNLSMAGVQTLADLYRRSMARASMTLQLLALTGSMALLLGLIGIYSIVSYAVSRRRHEVGVRLALGAARGEIRRIFVRHALVLVGIGAAIGLAGAVGLTRLMASQLFGISPLDPLTHVSVTLFLVAAAGLASYLSAWRASALDPVEVLKGE